LRSPPSAQRTIDIRQLKEKLRRNLPPDNLVLVDLLSEPDFLGVMSAEVLIPHYLQRLERELDKHEIQRKSQVLLRRTS